MWRVVASFLVFAAARVFGVNHCSGPSSASAPYGLIYSTNAPATGTSCFTCSSAVQSGSNYNYMSFTRYGSTTTESFICSTSTSSPTLAANVVTTGYCCACPDGYGSIVSHDSSATGSTSDYSVVQSCMQCPKGTYGLSDFTRRGYSSLCEAPSCITCPPGKYQDTTGASSCISCPSDKPYTFKSAAQSWYRYHKMGNIEVFLYQGATSVDACMAFPAGYYMSSFTASDGCAGQIPGTYNYATACPSWGQVNKLGATGSSADCSTCPAGKYFSTQNYDFKWDSVLPKGSAQFYVYGDNAAGVSCIDKCPPGYGPSTKTSFGITVAICEKCRGDWGEYGTDGLACKACPNDQYVIADGSTSCMQCEWPWQSDNGKGQNSIHSVCAVHGPFSSPMCLCLNTAAIGICAGIAGFISLLLLGFLCSKNERNPTASASSSSSSAALPQDDVDFAKTTERAEKIDIRENPRLLVGLLSYMVLPLVDNLTDLAFLLSNPFFDGVFFLLMGAFYVAPYAIFFKTLYSKGARPCFYLVPMPQCLLCFDKYDSFFKVVVGSILALPFAVLNLPVLLPQLFVGCCLYSTKSFCIKSIEVAWLHLWTGARFAPEGSQVALNRKAEIEEAEYHPIDEKVLNESIFFHKLLVTMPILAIKVANNVNYYGGGVDGLKGWTGLAYASVAFSAVNTLYGIWRFAFYKLKGVAMSDIPIDFSVAGIDILGKNLREKLARSRNVPIQTKASTEGEESDVLTAQDTTSGEQGLVPSLEIESETRDAEALQP